MIAGGLVASLIAYEASHIVRAYVGNRLGAL